MNPLPFITVDPPGARDLDQALHIERRGDGHRVSYAIADVAHFVEPGDAADRAAWMQGVTIYHPGHQKALYPTIVEHASLLPEQDRPAVLWTLDLDARGAIAQVDVRRDRVRSVAQHTYADVPADVLALMEEVGTRRRALERDRGGVSLPIPQQEVDDDDGSVHFRAPLPSEDDNAQLSLMTGMAAADLMLRGGAGLLRTLAPAEPGALERLRRIAAALGRPWDPGTEYGAFIRSLDPEQAAHAAILRAATGVMRGAGYLAFQAGATPAYARHAALAEEYAHVTAPLRRLADRYATECALAAHTGAPVPAWVSDRLADLPAVMEGAERHAAEVERLAVDKAEAQALANRVGETFTTVVVADGVVQLRDPAVRARCDGDPALGATVEVRLTTADPATGEVRFSALS